MEISKKRKNLALLGSEHEVAIEVELQCGREARHLPKVLWTILEGVSHGTDERVVCLGVSQLDCLDEAVRHRTCRVAQKAQHYTLCNWRHSL